MRAVLKLKYRSTIQA